MKTKLKAVKKTGILQRKDWQTKKKFLKMLVSQSTASKKQKQKKKARLFPSAVVDSVVQIAVREHQC